MEIRSITLFCNPDTPSASAARFFQATEGAFPLPVQTRRVALPPFPEWWAENNTVEALARRWQQAGANYLSLGPVRLDHGEQWLERLPGLLGASEMVFASAEVADTAGHLSLARVQAVARLIQQASTIQPNGFGNLYFTALANCPPGSPFFPVAYHDGGVPGFALALEAAGLALEAVQGAGSLTEARQRLVTAVEQEAARLSEAAGRLAEKTGITFKGLDFSLAPFPTAERSLAGAMESLGLPWVGAPGSLFAAAFLTEALGRAQFPRCGFSGLMLPVLEDSVLAERAGAGRVSVQDLLSYAAVCGVGLDTVPLPGDVSLANLSAILLDVAALALRLDKPLTARLMPLPGLQSGDPVRFDFPYFADSRVMALPGSGVSSMLAQADTLLLQPIHRPG